MGKKRLRNKYISKGVGQNISANNLSGMRLLQAPWEKAFNVLKAWKNGSNPWVTIDNPNAKNETAKRFIRVRMNVLKGGSYAQIKAGTADKRKKSDLAD